MRMRRRRVVFLALAAFLLATEILIALFARNNFVRGSLGDVLVVVLIYCAARGAFPARPKPHWLALCVFLFACAVEALQAVHIAALLGLGNIPILATIIGANFSWGDILCYLAGCSVVGLGETLYAERHHEQG